MMIREWLIGKCRALRNPHYGPAGYAARFLVNLGTLIWGTMVVCVAGQLDVDRFPFYVTMVQTMPEDVWGWGAIVTAIIGMWRLGCSCYPVWWGQMAYAGQAFFWLYVTIGLFTSLPRPVPAATAGAFVVICVLALYAVGSMPRRSDGSK